jgi:hypothetical protein
MGAQTPPFTIALRQGRFLEARVFSLRTPVEASAYSKAIAAEIAKLPMSIRPVLCADHRPVVIYSEEVANELGELFSSMNARLERVAIVVAPTNATLTLQLQRIVREARFENRRVFHDPEQAIAHLAVALDARESARARAFLGEFKPTGS